VKEKLDSELLYIWLCYFVFFLPASSGHFVGGGGIVVANILPPFVDENLGSLNFLP
jgi:hypothetical protein